MTSGRLEEDLRKTLGRLQEDLTLFGPGLDKYVQGDFKKLSWLIAAVLD